MKDFFEHEDVMVEDDPAFELMMRAALEDVEPEVPAGLAARMQAWTAVEMNAQQREIVRRSKPGFENPDPGHPSAWAGSARAFKDFGLLPVEERNRKSLWVSIAMNSGAAALVVFVAGAVRVVVEPPKDAAVTFTPLPMDKPVPPPPLRVVPEIVPPPPVMSQPRVEQPVVEVPPEVKPVMTATTRVTVAASAPVRVVPASAPKAVSLATSAVAVANPSPRPNAVMIGHPDSAIKSALTGPAVSPVTLGPGGASAPAGSGNIASVRSLTISPGNGPGSSRKTGGSSAGTVTIAGSPTGVPHGVGTGDRGVKVIGIAPAQQQMSPSVHGEIITSALRKPPVVTYVPTPSYTDEAKRLRIEGDVRLNVRLLANGGVEVLGVASGLGHGLDEAAQQAARSIRFKPATDDHGNAMDFATVITVKFQHT